jgi:hypothetical protein
MSKFKFKPDRDVDHCGLTNGQRAGSANKACREHALSQNAQADFSEAQDLLTDIFHLCDREGWEPGELMRMAANNWRAER